MKDDDTRRMKADALAQEAQQQLRGGCSGTPKHKMEDAADLFEKAYNLYRLAKMRTMLFISI